ncbi:MAG: DNA primase [Dysgonamonadaceae bacterium]|jgi:DNA primase|nr:DNA primase [Dysgonamonadaceae bacterium]
MIDSVTIERIQAAAQIYDVVSDFVTLRKAGVNYKGLCPFHEDRTPSFVVSPAKNICKCFACGEGGTPVYFIMKHEQLSYHDALRYLGKKYGIDIQEVDLTDEEKQAKSDRDAMFILNGFAQKTFTGNLFDTDEGRDIGLAYFRERGLHEDIVRKFQLGYALEGRDAFTQAAMKAGYKKQYLEKTGLTLAGDANYLSDRFRGRVVFPIHTLSGKVVAFGGRILKKSDRIAKYLNSPESEIYHKSNELYGIYFARSAMVKNDRCFLVEGYMDVIAMHQAGIEHVVASSGTALTQGQIRLIRRFTNNVTVLYDGDVAGIKAALRGIDLLLEAGLNIQIVLLPDGEDPDSFSRKQSVAAFNQYIEENATDFVRFKAGLLIREAGNDPVKKAGIITEITNTIALIPEEIVRLIYVKECAKLLDMDERVLVRTIAGRRREQLLQKKKSLYPDPEHPEETQQTPPTPSGGEIPEKTHGAEPVFQSPFDEYERNILYYVIRYGEQTITNQTENVAVNVIDLIASDLEYDEIEFHHPLHKKILEEGYAKFREAGFVAEHYFRNHPDPEISRFAVDISTDRYIESKLYSKHETETDEQKQQEKLNTLLCEQVPYVMFNYKDAILKHQMEEITRQIQQAQEENNFEKQKELTRQLTQLWKDAKKAIALQLRERIITKI